MRYSDYKPVIRPACLSVSDNLYFIFPEPAVNRDFVVFNLARIKDQKQAEVKNTLNGKNR